MIAFHTFPRRFRIFTGFIVTGCHKEEYRLFLFFKGKSLFIDIFSQDIKKVNTIIPNLKEHKYIENTEQPLHVSIIVQTCARFCVVI